MNKIHGHAQKGNNTPEYKAWCGMIARCRSQEEHKRRSYSDRGVSVCERWSDFRNFLQDMGPKPQGSTLERINNNLGYSKENCKWATKSEQARNRRTNTILTARGESRCLTEWLEIVGIKQSTLSQRLRYGWTHEEAIFGKEKRNDRTKAG